MTEGCVLLSGRIYRLTTGLPQFIWFLLEVGDGEADAPQFRNLVGYIPQRLKLLCITANTVILCVRKFPFRDWLLAADQLRLFFKIPLVS